MMRRNMSTRKPKSTLSGGLEFTRRRAQHSRVAMTVAGALALVLLASCGGGGSPATPVEPQVQPAPVLPGCSLVYPVSGAPEQPGLSDPRLSDQWYLQPASVGSEGVGATAAWSLNATGSGVRVAILDGPVESTHEDLERNVVAQAVYDYRKGSASPPLPCASTEWHGTAVAGIIAATRNNGLGGAGVAPAAKLALYNPISTGETAHLADALERDLASNHVYHNSWGSPDDGRLHATDPAVANAIARGLAQGRGGRGALYVFASGNGGCLRGSVGSCTSRDLASFDGYLNLPGVITACVANRQGALPSSAEEGENLLVCGLSGGGQTPAITTTAPQHAYRSDFDGASAAAPMVSGVIALMLSVRPDLSWRDIRLILAATARENQPNDPSWETTALTRPGPLQVMKRFSRKFGFGVVDAQAAVTAAQTWETVGSNDSLRSCTLEGRSSPLTLIDGVIGTIAFANDSVTATSSRCAFDRIEMVEVTFSADHQYSGDLRIQLVSPSGSVSRLADERTCIDARRSSDDCRPYSNWRFISNRNINESPLGVWTLQVADAVPGKTGAWLSWSLKLSGRNSPAQ